MPSIEEIVEKHSRLIYDERVWFSPRIPAAKVQGAIGSYGPGVAAVDVLVLVDNTVWGGCANGMLVTREYLYARDIMGSPRTFKISEIKTANLIDDDELFVNGNQFVNLNITDSQVKLCQLVLELACGVGKSGGGADPLPAVPVRLGPQECPGCGAALGYGGVCLYCGRKL